MSELSYALAAAVVGTDPGLAKRLGTEPEAYLELVTVTARAHDETREMLTAAVRSARGAGHSWEAVGRVLGMTRQAAQQRFGDGGSATDAAGERRLAPLNAFTEMEALRQAGAHGWHSVGYGAGFHIVRPSAYRWEHARVLAHSRRARVRAEDGWTRIGSGWFPWAYFKRQLDRPASPESAR